MKAMAGSELRFLFLIIIASTTLQAVNLSRILGASC